MDDLLSLSWGNASGLTRYRFWVLCDCDIGTQGQTNACFSQYSFIRLWCLWRQLRPISYVQMRRKKCTVGGAIKKLPGQFPWLLMLLLRLVVPLVLVMLLTWILLFWVENQPKLNGNSLKTLSNQRQHALYNSHYAYQQDQHCCCCLKLFWSQKIEKI